MTDLPYLASSPVRDATSLRAPNSKSSSEWWAVPAGDTLVTTPPSRTDSGLGVTSVQDGIAILPILHPGAPLVYRCRQWPHQLSRHRGHGRSGFLPTRR